MRAAYLEHLAAHPDGLLRECRPDHLTASTLVLSADGREVLLTLHAKAVRWFQLGGHCEPADDGLLTAATREAREESGLPGLVVDEEPLQLDLHPVDFCGQGPARHLDVRFLAVASPEDRPATSRESLAVRWWPVDELPSGEESLVSLVAAARRRFRHRDG